MAQQTLCSPPTWRTPNAEPERFPVVGLGTDDTVMRVDLGVRVVANRAVDLHRIAGGVAAVAADDARQVHRIRAQRMAVGLGDGEEPVVEFVAGSPLGWQRRQLAVSLATTVIWNE